MINAEQNFQLNTWQRSPGFDIMPLSLFLSLPLSLFLWGCTKHFNQSYPRSRSLSLCSWNTPSTMKGFQELLLSTFPRLRILWKGFGKLDDLVHASNVILIMKGWQNISANMKCESLPVHRAFKVLSTNTPELVRNQEETNAHSCFSLRSNYAFIETMLENYLNFRGEEEKKISPAKVRSLQRAPSGSSK